MTGYPIELKLQGKTALVVGLGPVGRRKAAGLREAGARVVGVEPAVEMLDPAGLEGIEVRPEPYHAGLLQGVSLAIAAGPPAVNRQVVHDARVAGIWVCSAGDPDEGDFTRPAVWASGPVVLTVSTSGASPALAAALRDRAADALGPAAAGLATILAELRPQVLARVLDPQARHRIFHAWADPRWLLLWSTQGSEAVRRALLHQIDAEVS